MQPKSTISLMWRVALCLFAALTPLVAMAADTQPPDTIDIERIDVLDLATAARIALADNPSLEAARARVEQAAQVVRQARSGYWPQLDASASAARVKMSERDLNSQLAIFRALNLSAPDIENPDDYYQADLTASWLVFDGFARRFRLAAARFGEQASGAAREDARRLLLSAVSFAFLQAQLAQENIAIAKADEAFNDRLLSEARLRYDVGAGPLSDVLNFQVRGNTATNRRLQEERAFQASLISLAGLLGLPRGRLPGHVRLASLEPTADRELIDPQTDTDVILQAALDHRPDLRRSDWLVRQAEAGVKTARAGYFPTVAVTGSVFGERPGDMGFNEDDFGNSIGVGMSWNIFAGGLTRARHGEARARLYEIEQLRNSARIDVVAEVQDVITRIETAQRQLTLQEANAELVQQQRDLVEKEYKAGVGSLVRLNEAQRDLTVALSQLTLSRVALKLAWYDLQTATGQILETFQAR